MPMPIIEENGGGVIAIIQRQAISNAIAERDGDVGENVGDMSETLSVTQRTMAILQKSGLIRHEGRVN